MSTTTRDCRVRSRGRHYQTLTRPPGTLHTTHHYTIAPSPLCCHCHLPLSLSDPCPITVHLSLRLSLLLNYFLTPDPLHLLHHTTYSLAHNLLHPAHPLIDVDIAILHLDTTTIKQKTPNFHYSIVLNSSQHPSLTTKHGVSSWTSSRRLITIVRQRRFH